MASVHSLLGSVPALIEPQVPSAPLPFLLAEHAWQRPLHVLLQHTPSTQLPLAQSAPLPHFLPLMPLPAHTPEPPQSTSLSPPFCTPSSQIRLPKQPSGAEPQVAICWPQVFLVQP